MNVVTMIVIVCQYSEWHLARSNSANKDRQFLHCHISMYTFPLWIAKLWWYNIKGWNI